MTADFIPGLELSRLFYAEQVRPLLDASFSGLPHSAALIGWGSDVLGFDTARSTDHNWGPRVQLFLADPQPAALAAASWPAREAGLCASYEAAARLHNELGLTAPVDPAVRPTYWDRPFRVLGAGRFAAALRAGITDPVLRDRPPVGAIDQFTDSTDALGDKHLLRAAIAAHLGLAS